MPEAEFQEASLTGLAVESRHRADYSAMSAFLASRLSLDSLRYRVFELGKAAGYNIWVSEHSQPGLSSRPLEEVQTACLQQVRAAHRIFCVLDGSYGTAWNQTEISILELELFVAAVARKEIYVFLLQPLQTDHRLETLLKAIRITCPALHAEPLSEEEITTRITRIIEQDHVPNNIGRPGPLVQFLAQIRGLKVSEQLNYLETRFLGGDFVPLKDGLPDKELISNLIQTYDDNPNAVEQLVSLWIAIRHLGSAPYDASRYREFVPLWNAVLSRWASTSAWYGLHGHILLGRLAAVNTLLDIRMRNPTKAEPIYTEAIQASRGAIASEYYSIAKLMPSWRARWQLRSRALWNVDASLAHQRTDPSGLLLIRGSILLHLGRVWAARDSYEQALAIRRRVGESAGRIGEAEVELGLALALTGHIRRAEHLLVAGVEKLEVSDRHRFTVRALRKLALFYSRTFRQKQAQRVLWKAYTLAKANDLEGHVSEIKLRLKRRRLVAP